MIVNQSVLVGRSGSDPSSTMQVSESASLVESDVTEFFTKSLFFKHFLDLSSCVHRFQCDFGFYRIVVFEVVMVHF